MLMNSHGHTYSQDTKPMFMLTVVTLLAAEVRGIAMSSLLGEVG